jgi:hypothetical protein
MSKHLEGTDTSIRALLDRLDARAPLTPDAGQR